MSAIFVNKPGFGINTTTCTLAATAYQATSMVVDDAFSLVIRFRRAAAGNPLGYIAQSAALVLVAAYRSEVSGGDVLSLQIQNANLVFVGSDTAGTIFEFITEQ